MEENIRNSGLPGFGRNSPVAWPRGRLELGLAWQEPSRAARLPSEAACAVRGPERVAPNPLPAGAPHVALPSALCPEGGSGNLVPRRDGGDRSRVPGCVSCGGAQSSGGRSGASPPFHTLRRAAGSRGDPGGWGRVPLATGPRQLRRWPGSV